MDPYRELDLLPDVSIAEEAHDDEKNGSPIEIIKDMVIYQAAYASNIDEYGRLRRPVIIELLEEQ